METSPLRRVREDLNLTVSELGIAAGIGPGRVSLAERGASPIPDQVLIVLEEVGVNAADLTRDHRLFQESRRLQILDRVNHQRRGAEPVTREVLSCSNKAGVTI